MPAQHLPLNTGMIIARYSHGRRPNTQQGSKAQAKIKTLTRHGWRRRGSRLIKSGDKPLRHRSNVLQENVSRKFPCRFVASRSEDYRIFSFDEATC